jgi:hypothetical protein
VGKFQTHLHQVEQTKNLTNADIQAIVKINDRWSLSMWTNPHTHTHSIQVHLWLIYRCYYASKVILIVVSRQVDNVRKVGSHEMRSIECDSTFLTLWTRPDTQSISPYYHNNTCITYLSLPITHTQKHYKRWVLYIVYSYTVLPKHPVILAMHANSARDVTQSGSVTLQNNSIFKFQVYWKPCHFTNYFTMVHDKHNTRIDSRRLELEWASFERIVIRIQKNLVFLIPYHTLRWYGWECDIACRKTLSKTSGIGAVSMIVM